MVEYGGKQRKIKLKSRGEKEYEKKRQESEKKMGVLKERGKEKM